MYDPMKHNYMKKLAEMQARGELPAAGLSDVDIAHDDWCAIYTGSYCNCEPEIRIRKRKRSIPPPANPSDN
jgi:hypothetical protein